MEEYVHISLERYDDLKNDYQFLSDRFVEIYKENENNTKLIDGLKKALLRASIDRYNIRAHSMEEVTDVQSYWFAYESEKEALLEVGITIEEMVEYARNFKAQYDAEKEEE